MAPVLTALWRGLAYASQWSGVGPMIAWARRRPGTWTVVTYHRVGTPGADAVHAGPDLVSPERFRSQVRWLRQRYEVLPVGEAFERLHGGTPPARPLASITFDDGYRDNVDTAAPILLQENCRATLYATVEAVREGLPPWTHRLACDLAVLVRRSPAAPAEGALRPILEACLRAHGEGDAADAIRRAVDHAKDLPDQERAAIVEAADRLSGGAGRRAAPMIGAQGLRAWRDAGMEIGSHTLRHRVLARLAPDERRRDLAASRAELETIAGTPVLHLAYPNGGEGDWDAATRDDAAAMGYRTAMTTIEGINRAGVDPLAIRRIPGAEDPLPIFAARVSGLWSAPRRWLKRLRRGGASGHGTAAPRPAGIRIAFIGGRGVGSAYSGIERYYEEIGSRLVARGHTVVAYSRAHFTPDVPSYRGVHVRRLPTLKQKHLETLVHSVLATLDVTFRRVDLVQYHALGSSPLAWIPRLAGKRTIVSVRGLDWQRAKWGAIARWYLKFCETTSVLCPNATAVVSRTLERHYAERHGARVRYIPNGVERRETCPPDAIRAFGLGERDYFLYAGRLSPEKGLECLIEAHRRTGGPTRLAIAGGSSYSDRYIEQLRGLAGERVVFTGFQTGRSLQELYSNALAFVLPSHMEGLSVALLEALSYGLPVIASDIPENRELVDACGGYVFPTDDAAALAGILARVAADPAAARRLGDTCRERVRARFDWDWVAESTERFYLEVLDRSGRAADGAGLPEDGDGAGEPRMEKKVGCP